MTSEELKQTIDFIIASQARLAAAQEQDRRDRTDAEKRHETLTAKVVELLNHQSQRMDRLDDFYQSWLEQSADFQRQALHLLNMILDRLPPATA